MISIVFRFDVLLIRVCTFQVFHRLYSKDILTNFLGMYVLYYQKQHIVIRYSYIEFILRVSYVKHVWYQFSVIPPIISSCKLAASHTVSQCILI